MSELVPDAFRPFAPVQESYCPGASVSYWRISADGLIVQEIIQDIPAGYMVRYAAWVNFPSTEGVPSHRWWVSAPPQPTMMMTIGQASTFANQSARTYGLMFGPWEAANMT
jgi:hypothetical protein